MLYFKKALQLDPKAAETVISIGTVYKDKGQFDEAIAMYHKALQLNPDMPEAHFYLGYACMTRENLTMQ